MKSTVLLLAGILVFPATAFAQPLSFCAATPLINDSAPPVSGADPIVSADWYINADRTIWAGPVPSGGWPAGGTVYQGHRPVKGQKTYWVRPAGQQLQITGYRLDAPAPPVEAHIPCCYTKGFQIVALYFPTEGCWYVTATAGASELTFVTQVGAVAGRDD
jgi:hypothetical protein